MENEKIKELEAIVVLLAKQIEDLKRTVKGGMTSKSDAAWLRDLKKEAAKIKI